MNLHCLLQEQGHNVVLPDADNTFHAIKVTTVHYSFAFFSLVYILQFTSEFYFKIRVAEMCLCSFRHLAKAMEDGVMTLTALNRARLLLVTVIIKL